MGTMLERLVWGDEGQDLIEYALLTAGIGLAGVAVWPAITTAIGVAYEAFDTNTQSIWESPNPLG
jgi:Flp pilus assembly pilin Flp